MTEVNVFFNHHIKILFKCGCNHRKLLPRTAALDKLNFHNEGTVLEYMCTHTKLLFNIH